MFTRLKKLQEGGDLLPEDPEIGVQRMKKQSRDLVMGEN
jgi:hypothetical protein